MDKEIIDKSPLADIDKEIDETTEVSTRIIKTITKLEEFQAGRYSTQTDEGSPNIPIASTPTRNDLPSTRPEGRDST